MDQTGGAPSSPSRPRWKPVPATSSSSSSSSSSNASDFLHLLKVDFSPIEKRFEEVFARLDALERAAVAAATDSSSSSVFSSVSSSAAQPTPAATASDSTAGDTQLDGTFASPPPLRGGGGAIPSTTATSAMDASKLAKELEALHASHLRLQIDQELAQSTNKVELESLQRELLALPQHADIHNFKAQLQVEMAASLKSVGDTQALLYHDVEKSLAMRELHENQWKSSFQQSMDARIQDIWTSVAAGQSSVSLSIQALEKEMVAVGATTRDTCDVMAQMAQLVQALEIRLVAQEQENVAQDHATAQLHAMVRQNTSENEVSTDVLQTEIDTLRTHLASNEDRYRLEKQVHDAFVSETQRAVQFCTSEITTTITSAIQVHHEKLLSCDTGLARHTAELKTVQDHFQKSDSRLSAIDGRLVQQEKTSATLTHVLQENHHEMTTHVTEIQKSLDLASQDRVSIKRSATELSFTVQEVQQTLQELGKMASTTDLSLQRTAAEIPKLHVLVHTNVANISKNRQSISDLNAVLMDEKKFTHQFHGEFDKQCEMTNVKLTDLLKRDEMASQGIAQNNANMTQIKQFLEEKIKYNSNLIHQLNTMVDSIAITESSSDMEDKLARFALQTAELCIKLEFMQIQNTGISGLNNPGLKNPQTEIKTELAVLLSKVIRFLGSGVAIDQNKYFLCATKLLMPTNDPFSGALVFEMPAGHVLDQLRTSKVSVFVTKMRTFIDQLRPVAQNVTHIHEFRDHLERKIKYVLEFGLANLFPNMGRPRHPNKKLGNLGTCIACDRPLEDGGEDHHDHHHHHSHKYGGGVGGGPGGQGGGGPSVEATDPEVEAVEDQKMRRSKLVASSSAAGVTHRIDTRTAVRGRSGAPLQSSASGGGGSGGGGGGGGAMGSVFHHASGTNEFVYRAGFRLPRPATAGASNLAKSASALAIVAEGAPLHGSGGGGGVPQPVPLGDEHHHHQTSKQQPQTLDDTVASCLEKVALVGKHSTTTTSLDVPSSVASSTSSSPLVRPHTAPLRSHSLPRLQVTIERTPS